MPQQLQHSNHSNSSMLFWQEMALIAESSNTSIPSTPNSNITIPYPIPSSAFRSLAMVENSEIISLMQRMDHSAHSILQLSREFQALLDGVLAKANLLWNKIESAPSAWNIPIKHSNIPTLCQSIISGLSTLSNNTKLLNIEADEIMEWCVDYDAHDQSLVSNFCAITPRIESARNSGSTDPLV
jgi:hypothetical protein